MILLRHLRVGALKQLRDVDVWFPRRGSLLVEGHNEAGKSTLFEAVYFALYGAPLVGEETRPTLDDLMSHDGTPVSVVLSLSAGDTSLEVRRTLQHRPGRRALHEADLRVRRPGAPLEHISGSRAVTDRIVRELSGLDGDALRNSCFMEQKALDRIETLKRDDREEAVARLLGLERLKLVEKELREALATHADALKRHEAALLVAQARAEAQAASEREMESATLVAAAEARELIEQRDRQAGEQVGQRQQDAALEERRQMLESRRAQVAQVKALLAAIAAGDSTEAAACSAHEALAATLARLDALAALERDELAPLEARLTAIREAEDARERVAALEADLARDGERIAAAEEARQADTQLVAARAALERAQSAASRTQIRETLERLVRATEVATALDGEDEAPERLDAERRDAVDRERMAGAVVTRSAAISIVALMLAAIAGAAGIVWHPAWGVTVLALVATLLAVRSLAQARTAHEQARTDAQRLTREHARLLAQHDAAQRFASLASELPALETRLRAANTAVPVSIAAAREQLAALADPGGVTGDASDASAALEVATLALAQAEAARQLAEARQAALRERISDAGTTTNADAREQMPVDAMRHSVDAERDALAARLSALDLADDPAALLTARGAAESELRRLRATLAERSTLERLAAGQAVEERESRRTLTRSIAELRGQAAQLGIACPPVTSDDTPLDTLLAVRGELRLAASARLAELDETHVLLELNSLDHERRGLSERGRSADDARGELANGIRETLARQGITCVGDEPRAALETLWPPLATQTSLSLGELRARQEESAKDAHHQRTRAEELAIAHQLDGIPLDLAACRAALAEADRNVRRHRVALDMAQAVRGRIVRQVMPETAVYMRMLLPELTAGRYRDVRLHAADDNGADLRISVWDQVAGRYVAKNLFSGGTRDQCSLALRLAFALATLPKELGAMPGFIFLDEPLSSFDAERTRALVDVLTRGAIGRQFAQVVLISHSQSFGRERFRYHLRLDSGRVADSNLPDEREAEALWDAESAVGGDTVTPAPIS